MVKYYCSKKIKGIGIMKKIFVISLSLTALLNISFTNDVLKFQQKVYAENFVTNNISKIENPVLGGENDKWIGNYIYFGNYPQNDILGKTKEPICWRILDNNNKVWDNSKSISENGFAYNTGCDNGKGARQNAPVGGNGILLISDKNLDVKQYHSIDHEDEELNKLCWGGNGGGSGKGCTLWAWLNNYNNFNVFNNAVVPKASFLTNAFTNTEQTAIMNTKVYSEDLNDERGLANSNRTSLTQDKIFIPSHNEMLNKSYGFAGHRISNTLIFNWSDYANNFKIYCFSLLRSPGPTYFTATYLHCFGLIFYDFYVCDAFGILPAFNLNPESIIFVSEAAKGKNFAVNLTPTKFKLSTGKGNEYKLTLHDETRNNFTAKKISQNGNEVTISYNNATTGNKEYISCLILDEQSEIKYYGKLKQLNDSTTTNGSVTLNIPEELQNSKYSVEILNEQCNGDYKTDFSSKPIKCI